MHICSTATLANWMLTVGLDVWMHADQLWYLPADSEEQEVHPIQKFRGQTPSKRDDCCQCVDDRNEEDRCLQCKASLWLMFAQADCLECRSCITSAATASCRGPSSIPLCSSNFLTDCRLSFSFTVCSFQMRDTMQATSLFSIIRCWHKLHYLRL